MYSAGKGLPGLGNKYITFVLNKNKEDSQIIKGIVK